jgi:hypothetical protein
MDEWPTWELTLIFLGIGVHHDIIHNNIITENSDAICNILPLHNSSIHYL